MTDEEYRSLPGITASAIKKGRVSMKAMRAAMLGEHKSDSPSMRWGRLVHMAILEPSRLPKATATWTGGRKAGKAWDEFCAEFAGREIITAEEMGELLSVSAVVHGDADAHRLITDAATEMLVEWDDPAYGKAKARCDGLIEGVNGRTLLEVKTAKDITPEGFGKAYVNMGYDLQLGWYAHGSMSKRAFIIAVSNTDDLDCAVYRVSDSQLAEGYEKAKAIAQRYHACEVCGTFPGVNGGAGVLDLVLPAWARAEAGEVEVGNGETMEGGEL